MYPLAVAPLSGPDLHCTYAELISSLFKLQQGLSDLPPNVITCVNPYCSRPENISDKCWFFIGSERGSKAIEGGVWKPKGDPFPVFSDTVINGWKTILEFFEEKTPHSWQKTGWVMHEFKITPYELGQSIHDVNAHETSVLCRVFLSGDNLTHQDIVLKYSDDDSAVGKRPHPMPLVLLNTGGRFEKGSTSNHQENDQCEQGTPEGPQTGSPLTDPAPENLRENDIISNGDYLELCDLGAPGSPSSSSDNSSCVTMSSDECFDTLDLLQDLEPREDPSHDSRGINVPLNNFISDRHISSMTRTIASGALIKNDPRSLPLQGTRRTNIISTNSANKGKEKKGECSRQNPSPNHREASPSSSDSEGGKKGDRRVKRHRKKYLCFLFQFLL
ncbi:hypothetical protein SAY87_012014 [Trapa incisa]|uniref:NAC domain-containing protein n=2 Tax=Trapa TaxID=22665 RepID=A0AAN7M077_TRANT|nr:hypothetical protein SAY87_012014 [Trapa incisa]KAK4795627.1 hypothetical protein SAY86_027953 [Trapa natans]